MFIAEENILSCNQFYFRKSRSSFFW